MAKAMNALFRLYPKAADIATKSGKVTVPVRMESGANVTVFGLADMAAVKKHLRLEGQTVFPIGVTPQQVGEEDDEVLAFGDKTPVAVSATHYAGGTSGGYNEVSVHLLTTYHRLDNPLRRNKYIYPFLLEFVPATRMFPLMTFTDSAEHAAINNEIYHVPTVHTAVNLERDSATGAIRAASVPGLDALEGSGGVGVAPLPHLLGEKELSFSLPDGSPSISDRFRKWFSLSKTCGLDTTLLHHLEGKRELRFTAPHGRGTVKGRAVNDYSGARNPVGMVSGVDMGDDAGMCAADYSMWVTQGGETSTSVEEWAWGAVAGQEEEGGGAGEAEGGGHVALGDDLKFEPELVVQTTGLSSVKLLPQRTVLPVHFSDQKPKEMTLLMDRCQEMLEARKPFMELPNDFREETALLESVAEDRKSLGGHAFINLSMSNR